LALDNVVPYTTFVHLPWRRVLSKRNKILRTVYGTVFLLEYCMQEVLFLKPKLSKISFINFFGRCPCTQ